MQQIVSKFGGTSVSSRETWNNILLITRKHLAAGLQPIIVCSARSQASNELELMVEAAKTNSHQSLQSTFIAKTLELARALDLKEDLIAKETAELDQWLTGIALLREAPFKTHAQILSLGELMLTRLGHAFLSLQGLNCLWFDAREALRPKLSQEMIGNDTVMLVSLPILIQIYLNNCSIPGLRSSLLKVLSRPTPWVKPFYLVEGGRIPLPHCLQRFWMPQPVKSGPMYLEFIPLTLINYPMPVF